MRVLIWLPIAQLLFILNALCNDSILSKFHQNGYKLRDVRVELSNFSEEYFYFYNVKTFKFNRTTPAVNSTFRMKKTVEDKCEVLVQAYKFLSNEYRTFPVRFQVNLKKSVEANAIGLGNIKNCGNITYFWFEKDITYHFCNFIIDETKLPPLIPNGRYMVEVTAFFLAEQALVLNMFGEVYTPIDYPKYKKRHGK